MTRAVDGRLPATFIAPAPFTSRNISAWTCRAEPPRWLSTLGSNPTGTSSQLRGWGFREKIDLLSEGVHPGAPSTLEAIGRGPGGAFSVHARDQLAGSSKGAGSLSNQINSTALSQNSSERTINSIATFRSGCR
jgi:hypothetical protein